MMKRLLILLLAAVLAAGGLAAQDAASADAGAADPGMEITGMDDIDALLEASAPADESGESASVPLDNPAAGSVVTQSKLEEYVKIHGNFNFKVSTGAMWKEFLVDTNWDRFTNAGTENSALNLDGNISFSVRPKDEFRIYGKTTMSLPLGLTAADGESYRKFLEAIGAGKSLNDAATAAGSSTTLSTPSLKIWELFSDFNLADVVYFRVGKQMVKWGTFPMAFWSPADILALTGIDINNRGADREGPVAIKAALPFGLNLVETYVVTPADGKLTSIQDVKLAGRATFVLAGWELGIGGSWQKKDFGNLIATVNGAIGPVSVFGEGLLDFKEEGIYLKKLDNPKSVTYTKNLSVTNPYTGQPMTVTSTDTVKYNYEIVKDRVEPLFMGTIGANYSITDIYMTIFAQYLFNGKGYANQADMAGDIAKYVMNGDMSSADVMSLATKQNGMHYLAVNLSETFVKDSKISASLYWLGNLSDGSGMFAPNVSIKINDYLNLGLNGTFSHGGPNTENVGLKAAFTDYRSGHSISDLAKGMDSGAQKTADMFDRSKFSLGVSLSLGSGEF